MTEDSKHIVSEKFNGVLIHQSPEDRRWDHRAVTIHPSADDQNQRDENIYEEMDKLLADQEIVELLATIKAKKEKEEKEMRTAIFQIGLDIELLKLRETQDAKLKTEQSQKIVQFITQGLKTGLDLSIPDIDGNTLLHNLVTAGEPSIVAEVCKTAEVRALLEMKNRSSITPLSMALELNNTEMSKVLLAAGAAPATKTGKIVLISDADLLAQPKVLAMAAGIPPVSDFAYPEEKKSFMALADMELQAIFESAEPRTSYRNRSGGADFFSSVPIGRPSCFAHRESSSQGKIDSDENRMDKTPSPV